MATTTIWRIGILLLFVGSFPFIVRKLAEKSGWKKLVEEFPTQTSRRNAVGTRISVYSMAVGDFSYQNTVRIIVTQKGLLIGMVWPFSISHPNLLIPWRAFNGKADGKNFLGKKHSLIIGNPEITTLAFGEKDFEKLSPYLRGKGLSRK